MGIGEAISALFVAEGATVVMASRELARVEAARLRIGCAERTLAVRCDVCASGDTSALAASTLDRFGRIDVWVNNAGFAQVDSVERMDMEVCRRMFDTNLFGAIGAMQAVIPVMKRQGSGSIINISSVAGSIAVPYMAGYGATKHALNCITRAARLEVGRHGVHIINVCPGYVNTNFSANAVRGQQSRAVPASIKGAIGPERVARAVLSAYVHNKREVVVPWRDYLVIGLYRIMPRVFEWGMMKVMKRG